MPDDLPGPTGLCHRISHKPEPMAFPDGKYCGKERFDDPSLVPRYRVLYTGERRACFFETLAKFRANRLKGLASSGITPEWFDSRRIGMLTLDLSSGPQRWLDLRSAAMYDAFDPEFEHILLARGIDRFDASTATDDDRELSQAIGKWAFTNGYHGIKYMSRRHPVELCWAIFEGTPIIVRDAGTEIDRTDPDLLEVVGLWNLEMPP